MSSYFSKAREPISSYTHFWGAVGGAAATVALVSKTVIQQKCGLVVAGVLLFGISLIALYSASSIYHYALCEAEPLRRLRKLDHAMIYVLIAGSYTPFCVAYMQPGKRELFLGCLWLAAIVGIVFKVVWLDAPRWIGTVIYLAMGWSMLLDMPAFSALPSACLALLAAGGISYSVGAVIYIIKKPNISERWGFHELFHLFILLGSAFHFLAVFLFVA